MCKNERTFDAKRMQIAAKKRPKSAFYMASKRGLRAEKGLQASLTGGLDERPIQPSGH
jgi:hypothetical protein